jgi:hypothetical protein
MNVTLEKAVLGGEQELKYEAKARRSQLHTSQPSRVIAPSRSVPWSLPEAMHSLHFTHQMCVCDSRR